MKKYVIIETVSDDDGNLYSDIIKVVNTEDEVREVVKKYYNEIIEIFNNPNDYYEDGDLTLDICEDDDTAIRRVIDYEIIEI